MNCPQCGHDNPAGSERCAKCNVVLVRARAGAARRPGGIAVATPPGGTPAPSAGEATLDKGAPQGWQVRAADAGATSDLLPLAVKPGQVLGNRYEILQLLGEGGMGAVYKARDRALDRIVALKIIRPERASHPEILQRFKQELILARQVTHKNVIRIFDLGEAEGIKFITMDYIEGQDLKALMKQHGKFPPEEAIGIIQQVCRALQAAHAEGVVHRDLKPQNVMVDAQGKVSVMDFGIARSLEVTGMTQTGALMGTPDYMSPEQARGERLDARSDLFSLGIILYELLTGKSPFAADTALSALWKRTQEVARPAIEIDPSIPPRLSDVVARCLAMERERRYASAQEVLQDLDARRRPRGEGAAPARAGAAVPGVVLAPRPAPVPEHARAYWKSAGAGLVLLLVVVAGFLFRGKIPLRSLTKPGSAAEPIALAVLPFRNASGDKALDWLGPGLAEMLRTDVGQSSYLRTVSSDRVHQILHDLRIAPESDLDPATLHRIGEFTSADRLVWGQYLKFGDRIRIDVTLQDLKRQRATALKVEAASEKELFGAIDQLARSIQKNLALSSSIVKELQATSVKPSSQSLQALRFYNEGLQLARQGNHLEALKRFAASTKEDPTFALAYSKLGQTYGNLGYDKEGEQSSRKAVELSENLPPQERYLILANDARISHNLDKAIESYENLAKVSPDDPQVHFDLAGLYEAKGSFDPARDHYAKVLARDPKYVDALLASGRVEIRRGNPQGALEYLNRALSLAIQLENQEEKATILQAIGVAYKRLNELGEALRYYQESLEIKRRIGDKRGIAASLNEIAQLQNRAGALDDALESYKEALKLRREIGDKKGTGANLIDLGVFYADRGQYDLALKLYKESLQIQLEVGNENYQALCLNNIGNIYLSKGQYDDALTYLQRALQLREKSKIPGDTALTLRNLANAAIKLGQYELALAYYLRALDLWRSAGDKRQAALESSSMGTLFEYQGRYGAALNAREEALKTFQQLQDRSGLAEITSGYGRALSQVGRNEEAQKTLDEALRLARELRNSPLMAQTLNFQGDLAFYRGDSKSAQTLFEQALQVASRTTDRYVVLQSRVNLAKLSVKEGRSQAAINALKGLAQQADALRLKSLSAECSVYLGEALLNSKDYSRARHELEAALRRTESLGLRVLLARSHYLLATALRLTGHGAEARRHYGEALQILDEIRKEARSDDLIKREDLRPIYAESSRRSRGSGD